MEFILQQVADNCTDFFNFSENKIFNNEEMYSFFHLMEDFSTLINGMAIIMLEGFLSKLDDQLYDFVKQEKRYHVQEKSRGRTIITQWGEVKIARRYYKDKVTGEFVYLLDRVLDLPSHKQIDPYCASKIIKHATSMSYANAVEASTPCQLSRQTVKNLVHSLPTPPTTLQTEIEAKTAETVYIEVDEDHVSLQTGKNINMKLATVYTDKVDVGSNRMELVEKHSFTGLETPEEFWMQIDSYLAEAYVGSSKVYIIGDGASWIMSVYRGDIFNYFASVETAKVLSSVKVAAKKMRKPYPYITYSPTPRTGILGVE